MMAPVLERMDRALVLLADRYRGKRAPKAFYLSPADWDEFRATADLARTVTLPWGNNPPQLRTDPAHQGVPVRPTIRGAPVSKLYDHSGQGTTVSGTPKPCLDPKPVPAEQLFEALDRVSRKRALTDEESLALEHAMHGRVIISRRAAIRLGVKL